MRSPATTASELALAVARRRVPHWWADRDDQIHEFLVHVLEKMSAYDPAKAEISTYVYDQWRYWYADAVRARVARGRAEVPSEVLVEIMAPPLTDRHALTGSAGTWLALVPEAGRPLVETHLAYGASLTATAELHGVSDRTVSRWVATARDIWDRA